MADKTHEEIAHAFGEAVNMTPAALDKWLQTDESKSVGWADGTNKHDSSGSEAVGHQEGRRIVEIKHKKTSDLTDDDYAHMNKVVGYVHRHLAQGGPKAEMKDSRWRHSLMNWGHDPLKD